MNTRVLRQAEALSAAGAQVTVLALAFSAAFERDESIETIVVAVPHPLQGLSAVFRRRSGKSVDSASPAANGSPEQNRSASLHPILRPLRILARPFGELFVGRLFARAAVKASATSEFDCVQAHDSRALRAAWALAQRNQARVIYDAVEAADSRSGRQLNGLEKLARRFESRAEQQLVRRCARVLTVGPALAAWLQKRYRIDLPVVIRNCRNFVSATNNREMREELALSPDTPIALYLNTIWEQRGLEQLLGVLELLPELHLVMLGPVPQEQYLNKLLREAQMKGVDTRVHLPRLRSPEQLIAFCESADVGVVPLQNNSVNNYLSLPNRVFEFIMARVPMSVSNFPDLAALVNEYGVGNTFDETDPKDMARAVAEMLEQSRKGDMRERLESAANALSWEREGQHYVTAVRDTVADSS